MPCPVQNLGSGLCTRSAPGPQGAPCSPPCPRGWLRSRCLDGAWHTAGTGHCRREPVPAFPTLWGPTAAGVGRHPWLTAEDLLCSKLLCWPARGPGAIAVLLQPTVPVRPPPLLLLSGGGTAGQQRELKRGRQRCWGGVQLKLRRGAGFWAPVAHPQSEGAE